MQNKQRVLALDYFRGICMLAVVVNHFSLFASPLTVLAGGGRLWVGAAELFFLISGVTFGIVRGKAIKHRFGEVIKKSFKRAGLIYVINLLTVAASIAIAFQLAAHGRIVNIPGDLPDATTAHTIWQIISLQYGYGWADFLMYYTLLLVAAPFALKVLHSRLWPVVPVVSLGLFGLTTASSVHANAYLYFLVWQVYFFVGLTIARFRLDILAWYNRAKLPIKRATAYGLVACGVTVLAASSLAAYNHKIMASVAPGFIKSASNYLAGAANINLWFSNGRTGLARLLVGLLTLATLYVIYQAAKAPLLKYTGKFVMAFGRNSLQIFVLQALAIPLVSALPLNRSSQILNTGLTAALIFTMWLLTHKWSPLPHIRASFASLRAELINGLYLAASGLREIKNRLTMPGLE